MTTLNNDELREQLNKAISEAMGQLRPVVKHGRGTGVMGVTSASDLLRIDVLALIASHDQQLLEAILEGIVDEPKSELTSTMVDCYDCIDKTDCIHDIRNQRNEEIRQHIKSVFNKEGE